MGADQEIYVPPADIQVRILGLRSQYVLVSRNSEEPKFWHHPKLEEYDDQWFNIIPGAGTHEGTYLIKSVATGRVLWCREKEPQVGAIDGEHEDNFFVFEPGTGKRAGWFRMKTPSTGYVFVSRTHADPKLTSWWADYEKNDDNYFVFLTEDMAVDSMTFDTDAGSVGDTRPMFLGTSTATNSTSSDQQFSAHFTLQEDNEYSYEHTSGFSVTIGTEFNVGVPGVAEGKVSMSASHSEEFKWGNTTKTGKGTAYDFPVLTKPHTKVTAHAMIQRSTMNVPYKMVLKSKKTGCKATSEGIFKGVQMYNASCTWTEEKLET